MTDPRRLYHLEGRDAWDDHSQRERRAQRAARRRIWGALAFWVLALLIGLAGLWITASIIITTPPMECLSC